MMHGFVTLWALLAAPALENLPKRFVLEEISGPGGNHARTLPKAPKMKIFGESENYRPAGALGVSTLLSLVLFAFRIYKFRSSSSAASGRLVFSSPDFTACSSASSG